MRYILSLFVAFLSTTGLLAQGSGLGYFLDLGGGMASNPSMEYDQEIHTRIHNGFIRIHSEDSKRATQFILSLRKDEVRFRNTSDFLAPDNSSMLQYNSDGTLERSAWRFGITRQHQFGSHPDKLCFALNGGMFYEGTLKARRQGYDDGQYYDLFDEVVKHNFGATLGAEFRIYKLTFGYRLEKLFWDVLDHEYILSQELNTTNSTELRGLKMNPFMHYFYIGVQMDFY
jgi:hypothetical protein